MPGTKEGGQLAAERNKAKHGSDFYARIGAKGGKAVFPGKGFAGMTKKQVSAAGRKGGAASSRAGVGQPASFKENYQKTIASKG